MAAGDLLDGPDDREFDGHLISAADPAGADVWVDAASVLSGWHVTHSADNLATQAGMSLGVRRVDEMYPSIVGVRFRSLASLEWWIAAEGTTGDLAWWDRGRDRLYTVEARLAQVLIDDAYDRRRDPRAHDPATVADLLWEVPRPLDIAEIGGSS